MPRYYCDYCDTYLTHDSPSVRKQHNNGYKHKANVRSYYQQFEEQQTQSLIDQRIKEHLGQSGAFQVGGAFNQHMLAQRPRLPVPTPLLPMPVPQNGQLPVNTPLMMRPPILPRPLPVGQVYPPPQGMPQMVAPPGAPPLNGVPRPPTGIVPTSIPGNTAAPTPTSGAPPMAPPPAYQTNSGAPSSGGYEGFNMSAPAPEANH